MLEAAVAVQLEAPQELLLAGVALVPIVIRQRPAELQILAVVAAAAATVLRVATVVQVVPASS